MNKREKIMTRIKSDYDLLTNQGMEVLGVFLQGSQNYKLDYEGSDIDTKAIIIPSFDEFLLGKKMKSHTHVLLSDEHIDYKDIRLMFEMFKKQNINFVEILFTDYYYINPKYEVLYQPMLDNAEIIARYDIHKALNTMAGMSMEKFKALEHPYPAKKHLIDEFGYDSKQLHHILRLNTFIKRYINGDKFKDCLVDPERNYLIRVKSDNGFYNLEEARELAKEYCDDTYATKCEYFKNNEKFVNVDVEKLMYSVLNNIIRKSFREQLLEGGN